MKSYITSDLYIAAAIILSTGQLPEFKVVQDFKKKFVNLEWPDRIAIKSALEKIARNSMDVEVREFKDVHINLKSKCINLIKEAERETE
jgi:hypothetical protein